MKNVRKQNKIMFILVIGLLMISLAAGCGTDSYQSGMDAEPADRSEAADEQSGQGIDRTDAADRRIIRNAAVDLSAQDVLAAYEQILGFVYDNGGYEANRHQRQQNDRLSIDAQLRLPPEQLDAFLEFVEGVGDVISKQISTEDITSQYFDAQTRLESMEKALARYYDYLLESESIEETLSVQSEINHLTVEIESLKGKLALWDTQLKESTITLRLRQIDDPLALKQEIDWSALSWEDMQYLMQAGLKTVLNVLIGFFQWFAIVLVAASPLWIAALAVILIVRKKSKKKRKQLQTDLQNQQRAEQAAYAQAAAMQHHDYASQQNEPPEPAPSMQSHPEHNVHDTSSDRSDDKTDQT